MIDFLYRISRGYRKLGIYDTKQKIEKFVNGIRTCNIYKYYSNPFNELSEKECIVLNDNISFNMDRLKSGVFDFDLRPEMYSKTVLYLGDKLIIRHPRGYNGAFTYYVVEKNS